MFPAFFKSPAERARDTLVRERKNLIKRKKMLQFIAQECSAEIRDINMVLDQLDNIDEPKQYVPFFPL